MESTSNKGHKVAFGFFAGLFGVIIAAGVGLVVTGSNHADNATPAVAQSVETESSTSTLPIVRTAVPTPTIPAPFVPVTTLPPRPTTTHVTYFK